MGRTKRQSPNTTADAAYFRPTPSAPNYITTGLLGSTSGGVIDHRFSAPPQSLINARVVNNPSITININNQTYHCYPVSHAVDMNAPPPSYKEAMTKY